jgi:ketose-bisphosphate aldolase
VLASLPEILAMAQNGPPVGAFSCYGMSGAVAVVRAAAARDVPTVLLVSGAAYAAPTGDALVATLLAIGDRAPVPVCVQLDHANDLALIERALTDGVDAVLADGSRLDYAGNVALTRTAAELAAAHGAHLEVELGHVAGDEDLAMAAAAGALTDPDQAAAFVTASGAALLAVSIGNVHGRYAHPPRLDIARLEAIRKRVEVPLALHGASGLPDAQLGAAIRAGITKINVNTELRSRAFDALDAEAPAARARGLDLLGLGAAVTDAIGDAVGEQLDAFARLAERGGR